MKQIRVKMFEKNGNWIADITITNIPSFVMSFNRNEIIELCRAKVKPPFVYEFSHEDLKVYSCGLVTS